MSGRVIIAALLILIMFIATPLTAENTRSVVRVRSSQIKSLNRIAQKQAGNAAIINHQNLPPAAHAYTTCPSRDTIRHTDTQVEYSKNGDTFHYDFFRCKECREKAIVIASENPEYDVPYWFQEVVTTNTNRCTIRLVSPHY